MGISETKKQIVIDNYFKNTCDVNTSIKEAFTKGFEVGLTKAIFPKDQYKADMMAVLTDILERIKADDIKEEKADNDWGEGFIEAWGSANLNAQMVIQEKINSLKEVKDGSN